MADDTTRDTTPSLDPEIRAMIEENKLRLLRETGNRARRDDVLIELLATDAVGIARDLNSELDDVLDTLRVRLRLAADTYIKRYL